ncbi:unnamed protein product [Owenia fusiformis]|uniref:Uncharacterized protein n=1 Tax=Owenia fusiformis TaxID=6347 RepID=A0A8J1XYY8_OWEFU|nr:unnamed protein product [Owenia fusiformis]
MNTYFALFVILVVPMCCSGTDWVKVEQGIAKQQGQADCVDWNGVTRPADSTWMSGCIEYTCYSDGSYAATNLACERHTDSVCIDVGIYYYAGCTEYQCQYVDGYLGNAVTRKRCARNTDGLCVDIGATWFDGCIGYECFEDTSSGSWGTRANVLACSDGEGGCQNLGNTWKNDNCVTYQCIQDGNYLISQVINVECNTCTEACVPMNSTGFCFTIGGNTYQNCLCYPDGNLVRYQCSGYYGYQSRKDIKILIDTNKV